MKSFEAHHSTCFTLGLTFVADLLSFRTALHLEEVGPHRAIPRCVLSTPALAQVLVAL